MDSVFTLDRGKKETPPSMDYPQMSRVYVDSVDNLTEGLKELLYLWTIHRCSSMDYPPMSRVSVDTVDNLTEGLEELLYLWTIHRCPSMDYPPYVQRIRGYCGYFDRGGRRLLHPSMDYPRMFGVSTDTLTDGIHSICGVTLDIFYELGMSDSVLGHGCLLSTRLPHAHKITHKCKNNSHRT